MSTSALLAHACAALLFILAFVIGEPALCVVALAIEVGYAALNGRSKH